jgi:HEAT repeat protein
VTTRALLIGLEVLVLLACLVLATSVITTKVVRSRREARTSAALAPVRGALIELAAGEPGTGVRVLHNARGATADAIDEAAVGLLSKVRGEPAAALVDVLEAHGAIDRARADVHHRSTVRRARAVQLLGLARVADSSTTISEALEDPALEVRSSAAYAASYLGDAWLAAPVLRAVGQGEGIPAGLAADALLEMGIGITLVLRAGLRDEAPRTRMVAAHVSGAGAFIQTLPELRLCLVGDPDTTVRLEAATALGRIGRESEVVVLASCTGPDQPTELRRVCVQALGMLGSTRAHEVLEGLLDDADPRLAELAAQALVATGSEGRAILERRCAEPAAGTALLLTDLRPVRA